MFLFRFSMMMMMTTMMMLVLLSLMASGGSANAQQQQQQQSSTAGVSNSLIDSPPPASPFCSSSVPDGEPFYALMVDAGSSGSRILLYTWSGDDPLGPITEIIPPYEDIPDQQFKVEPGISSYAATGKKSSLLMISKRDVRTSPFLFLIPFLPRPLLLSISH